MSRPILHHTAFGLRSQIVRLALAEKGIAFASARLDPLALLPLRTPRGDAPGIAPVLRVGGLVLDSITDVAEHLDATLGGSPLQPVDEGARYDMDTWTAPILAFPDQAIERALRRPLVAEPGVEEDLRRIGGLIDRLEARLAGRAFLAGEAWSIADAVWTGVLAWLRLHGLEELSAPARHPGVHAYYARMRIRPSFDRGFVFDRPPSPWGLLALERRAWFALAALPPSPTHPFRPARAAVRPSHESS